MIIAVSSIHRFLSEKNYMFHNPDAGNGDDLLLPWIEMKKYAGPLEITMCTPDTVKPEEIDVFLFIDMPMENDKYYRLARDRGIPSYLLMAENGLKWAGNFDRQRHVYFKKVFTYRDDYVDNSNYLKTNYSFNLPKVLNKDLAAKDKLCVMVAGYNLSSHPLELYSHRIEAIRWFEQNHPEEFSLYGFGWDNCYVKTGSRILNRLIRELCRFDNFKRKYKIVFPSHRGEVKRKYMVMPSYKFSICFENTRDIPGYITEKIFDSFFAGCVPVYWGANNIAEHIPKDCFIDFRDYKNMEDLYTYISNLSDLEYLAYLKRIEAFLNSPKAHPFSIDYFVKTIMGEII